MSKTYYKVVNQKLESVTASRWPIWENSISWKDYIVQYKENEWVWPIIPKTDLMVFENYKDARIFADGYHNSAIYRCKVKNPKKIGSFSNRLNSIPEFTKKIIELKNKKLQYTHIVPTKDIPKGTVFCSAVKLIERV